MKTKLLSIATAFLFLLTMMSTIPNKDLASPFLKLRNEGKLMFDCPTCPQVTNFVHQGQGYFTWNAVNPTPNYGVYGFWVVYSDALDYDARMVFNTGYDPYVFLGHIGSDYANIMVQQVCFESYDHSYEPSCYGEPKYDFVDLPPY